MRSRLFFAALAVSIVAAPTIGVSSSAQTAAEPVAKANLAKFRMAFTFDYKTDTLRPHTRVRDASGHKNGGVVVVQALGRLKSVKGVKGRGRAAHYPCRGCGRALIEVQDRKGLDPRARLFAFGASVRVPRAEVGGGANLVQKGYFKQLGGQFKLQLEPTGAPSCVFTGSLARILVTSSVGIANNKWHSVKCMRGKVGVSIWVDGKLRGSVAGSVGAIGNTAPIRVGAKKINAGNKQFRGSLDNVYLRFLS